MSTLPQRIGIIGSVPIMESPPAAPVLFTAVGGVGSIVLTWDQPSTGGSPITSYTVLRGTTPGGETTLAGSLSPTSLTYPDTTAVSGTTYYYTVQAINAIGTSPSSNELSAVLPTFPNAPVLTAIVAGNAQVSLSWTAPATGGSPITSYVLLRGTTQGGETSHITGIAASALSYVDTTSVVNNTQYFYTLKAVNGIGTSAASNELSATPSTGSTVPVAPTLVSAVPANGSITLNWTENNAGGSPVTSFTVLRSTASGRETPLHSGIVPTATSYIDSTVTDGVTYFYTVMAVNVVGNSAQSNEESATPQPVAPGAPSLVAVAGNAQAVLNWTAPASTGGATITNYLVYRGLTATSLTLLTTLGAVLTFTDTGLTNGTQYFYAVHAQNVAGQGPASNVSTVTPTAPPTGKPLWGEYHAGNYVRTPSIVLDYGDNNATTYSFTSARQSYLAGKRLMLKMGVLTQAQATSLASLLVANGQANAIVPFMWEGNQGVNGWEPGWNQLKFTAAQFISQFNNQCAWMRAVSGANFLFAWCPNVNQTGNQAPGRNQLDTFPGTGVNHDIVVAPDGYDNPGDTGSGAPSVVAQAAPFEQLATQQGAKFAGYCESGNNGSDDPTYWTDFLNHAAATAYTWMVNFQATVQQGGSFDSTTGTNSRNAINAFYAG